MAEDFDLANSVWRMGFKNKINKGVNGDGPSCPLVNPSFLRGKKDRPRYWIL